MTIEQLIKQIREYHQMDIYTVNESWCIQLFEPHVCANDEESCVYECDNESLLIVLEQAWEWITDRWRDS